MPDENPKYKPSAEQMIGVGENNTFNFFLNLGEEERAALLSEVLSAVASRAEFESLLKKVDALSAHMESLQQQGGVSIRGDASARGDIVGRDKSMADVVYGDKITVEISSSERETLRQIIRATHGQPRLQQTIYAALDYAALARQLQSRQKRGDALKRAKREENVYIHLAMTFSRHRRVSAQAPFESDHTYEDIVEAVQAPQAGPDSDPHAALVLLGTPGGGKSTALRHLALDRLQLLLAGKAQHLPLFISLGEYKDGGLLSKLRSALNEPELELTPLNFLRAHWFDWFGEDDFEHALDAGGLWLILDGLNEIPDRDARIPDWQQFFDRDGGRFGAPNRALIACRRADYGNRLDLPYLDLKALDVERIRDYLGKRLDQTAGDEIMARLKKDDDLMEVVSNPFWLKMLADYRRNFERLPDNRTALIEEFVQEWFGRETHRADLQALSPQESEALQTALDGLAYGWLEQDDNAPMPWAAAAARCAQWAGRSGEEALRRAEAASLLVSETVGERSVKFYHQLLLEYFAGRELARRFRRDESQTARWRVLWASWSFVHSEWQGLSEPPTTRWEEATVFASARPDLDVDDFVRAVLNENPPLAARCVLESGRLVAVKVRQEVIARLLALVERRDALLDDIPEAAARLALRIAAGQALGKLGDARILAGQGRVVLDDEETTFIEPIWCALQSGPFRMGSDTGYAAERPAHTCDVITVDYAIGMFPVTNAEFECFIRANGYADARWWQTAAARHWLAEGSDSSEQWLFQLHIYRENPEQLDELVAQNRMQPDVAHTWRSLLNQTDEEVIKLIRETYAGQSRERPVYWDDHDLNAANQPVVGVCWHEALAYCIWLTHALRAAGRIQENQVVTLPNEPEWEKATGRAGQGVRDYPWGNEFDDERANTLEGRVLRSTAVGIYDNASACGALDMSGNVWEWTRSRWGNDPQTPTFAYPYSEDFEERERFDRDDFRIVRGGSWFEWGVVRAVCVSLQAHSRRSLPQSGFSLRPPILIA